MIRPILPSNFLCVRFRRKAISENFANAILAINRKVAAYCAWKMSAVQAVCIILRLALRNDDNPDGSKGSRCCPRPFEVATDWPLLAFVVLEQQQISENYLVYQSQVLS